MNDHSYSPVLQCKTVVTDRVSTGGNAIASIRLSACFHSIFVTDWPFTLNFCMSVGHDHSSQGIEGQGLQLPFGLRIGSGTYFWSRLTFDLVLATVYIMTTACRVSKVKVTGQGQLLSAQQQCNDTGCMTNGHDQCQQQLSLDSFHCNKTVCVDPAYGLYVQYFGDSVLHGCQ